MRAAAVGRSYNNKLSVQPDSTNLSLGSEGLAGGNSSFEYYIDKGGKVISFFILTNHFVVLALILRPWTREYMRSMLADKLAMLANSMLKSMERLNECELLPFSMVLTSDLTNI